MGTFDAVIVAAALGAAFLFLGRSALRIMRSFKKGAAPACAACASEAGPAQGSAGGDSDGGATGQGAARPGWPTCASCKACPKRSACPGA